MRLAPLLFTLALSAAPLCAAEQPAGLDPLKWQALLERAAQSPERHQHQGLESRALSHVVPQDRRAPRDADYLSVIGFEGSEGRFRIRQVSIVIEQWRRPEPGIWAIEQWLLGVEADGRLRTVSHQLLLEQDDGRILDIRRLPSGPPDDPAELAFLGAKLDSWFAWLGL